MARPSLFVLGLLATLPAHATDLINKDSQSYPIAVNHGGGTMKTSITGGTNKSGVCPSAATACHIAVEGIGAIDVTGGEDVVIKDGVLIVR